MKKKLAVILMSCMILNTMVLSVHAEEDHSIDSVLYSEETEAEMSDFSDAVLPEGLEAWVPQSVPEQFQMAKSVTPEANDAEWAVLYLTNAIRVQNGLDPLAMEANLQYVADVRVNELTTLFDHTRPDGSDCFTALDGLDVYYSALGENIACGQRSPIEVINGWWNSPGHRANMLNGYYSHMGTGFLYDASAQYGSYWVQFFGGDCTPDGITVLAGENDVYLLPGDREIDELGLLAEVECQHGISYLPIMESMCTGLNRDLKNEEQTVTVNYKGKSATFTVCVCDPMPFTDIPSDQWYYHYVEYVYYNQIMTGLNATKFGPNESLARAQFAVILHRLQGEPSVSYKNKFPDVSERTWYTDAVMWASDAGIVNGYTDTGKFGPGDVINREQMAVMMYRYANYLGADTSERADFSHFADASSVNEFAAEAMQWAVGNGIITGKDNGTRIDPQGNASRAECATIINRFMENLNY